MKVLLGDPPPEVEAYLARRRELGQDLYDEVWEGTYHVAPAAHPWHSPCSTGKVRVRSRHTTE